LTRKLIFANLCLLAIAGLLAWKLRVEWLQAHARENALYRYRAHPKPAQPLPALPKVPPFEAASYAAVAQNNLFSYDRNPNVILDPVEPPKPKPVPPFPVARGVMLWDGVPPTIVLSEKPGGDQKGYHPGDTIGEWTIASIDNKYVVFTWDGKEFQKRIDELLDRTPIEVAAAPAPVAAAAPAAAAPATTQLGSAPSSNTSSNSSTAKSGPGADMGGGLRGCVPGDSTPDGAVVDGMKKFVSSTPFGVSCHWEPVK